MKNQKNKYKSEKTKEEIEKYNQRKKELEEVFSDENYYEYIKRLKLKKDYNK